MLDQQRDEWQFGLWSSLALELLARAALAHISPTLLADTKNNTWHHIYYGLGKAPPVKQYVPRSIGTSDVLARLHDLLPEFTKELKDACVTHIERRNTELHSGDMAFDLTQPTIWLPSYYEACSVLLKSMGQKLDSFVGSDEAKTADALIAAARDDKKKHVTKLITDFSAAWKKLGKSQQQLQFTQAESWATKHIGHRVECPACKSTAIVTGDPIAAPKKTIEGDIIIEKQEFLPAKFECIACGLKLTGLSSLSAANLGTPYISTSEFEASEYYSEDESHYWEDDNNEPY